MTTNEYPNVSRIRYLRERLKEIKSLREKLLAERHEITKELKYEAKVYTFNRCCNIRMKRALMCEECLAFYRKKDNQRVMNRVKNGKCKNCSQPIVKGRTYCKKHLDMQAIRAQQRRLQRKMKGTLGIDPPKNAKPFMGS